MRFLLLLSCCLLLSAPAATAKTVYDVELPEQVTIAGEKLTLNGYGLRKKLFFKVYLGSLYTSDRATSTSQVLGLPGHKLIRMNFIYHKVDRDKITDAFAEGFAKNSPQLNGDANIEKFLRLFQSNFVAGDQVALQLAPDGTVSAIHNSTRLGSITSKPLSEAVLLIYLGDQPADEDMKAGMLGGNQ